MTDFSLQIGASLTTGDLTGSGNVKLDDNDDAGGPNLTGYTAVISPDIGAVDQALTGSVDGTAANQTLADSSANDGSINMTYGAAGGDTLNGSNDADYLRGAPGTDTLNGNGGNDLVFGAGDTINGGDGIDILRVDDGAIALTKIEDGSAAGPLINLLVDLEGQNIQNVESILITELVQSAMRWCNPKSRPHPALCRNSPRGTVRYLAWGWQYHGFEICLLVHGPYISWATVVIPGAKA